MAHAASKLAAGSSSSCSGDAAHVLHLGLGVDGDDVVARRHQRRGELAVAGADLEHARGRRRQRGAHERDDVIGGHRTFAQSAASDPVVSDHPIAPAE